MEKKRLRIKKVIGCISLFLFGSCTTYLIPIDSFKEQFAGIDSTSLRQVKVRGPYGEIYNYLANPIEIIHCVDKNGSPHELENKPSIEIRFTYGQNNKKTIFYFDRVYLSDNTIFGAKSRFISNLKGSIPLNQVTKIEVQDGKKKFSYDNVK